VTLTDVFLVAHIAVFAIWFGTDVATFSLSRRVVDPTMDVSSRLVIARAMISIEVIARLCLPTTLALGLSLWISAGLADVDPSSQGGLLVAIWIAIALWVGLVWAIHRQEGGELATRLASIDLVVRTLVCAVLFVAAIVSLVGDGGPFLQSWLAVKVVAFALIMSCGIAIRFILKPFSVAFAALVSGGSTPEREKSMTSAIQLAQPFVAVIWLSLLTATALAVIQPSFG
jgi:hypothetical protein